MQQPLVELFSRFYDQPSNPDLVIPPGYTELPPKLLTLFQKWNIHSLFDAGCGDRRWMRHNQFAEHGITYMCGDVSVHVAEFCKQEFPDIQVLHHDLTTDAFPAVDLLFSSDVAIHLSTENKIKFLKNFLSGNIKYLLMTTDYTNPVNTEIEMSEHGFPFAHLNWSIDPWNFPAPLDIIYSNLEHTKALYLWSKQQIQQAMDKL